MQNDEAAQELEVEMKLDLDGELRYLSQSLILADPEEKDITITETSNEEKNRVSNTPSLNIEQSYGHPLSPEAAAEAVPIGSDGLIRYAIVIPDDFCIDGKLISGLNKRDFDLGKGAIKPRRPSLPITKTNLLRSLTKLNGEGGPRYIFSGILNGWPSLRHFELIGLEKKRNLGRVQPPDYIMDSIGKTWTPHWRAEKEGREGNNHLL